MRCLTSRPPTGYPGRPLAPKLGVGAGCRLYLRAARENYAAPLTPLPGGAQVVSRPDAHTDIVHRFATRRAALRRALPPTLRAARPEAPIWVSSPKRSYGAASDITEDVIRKLSLPLGLADAKVCAVDKTWSPLKLGVRTSARPDARSRPPAANSGRRPK